MLWVIEKSMFFANDQQHFIEALQRKGSKYLNVDVIPFTHEITPLPKNVQQPIVAMGSTLLTRAVKEVGWLPGVWWDDSLRYERYLEHYGQHMLNADAQIVSFGELTFEGAAFVRPCEDLKIFGGTILDSADIANWKDKVIQYAAFADKVLLTPQTNLVVAPLKRISKEYRFFVINGIPRTACMYKENGKSKYSDSDDFGWPAHVFAWQMCQLWSPLPAFVMDIAELETGELKVIELNTFNSAGFYNCDPEQIIDHIECLFL